MNDKIIEIENNGYEVLSFISTDITSLIDKFEEFKKRIEKLLKSTNESYNLLDGELKDIVGKMQWEINENTSRLDKSILNSLNYMNNIYSCLNVSLNRSEHNNIVVGDFINYGEID